MNKKRVHALISLKLVYNNEEKTDYSNQKSLQRKCSQF